MTKYPGRMARALNDSFDYEKRLREEIKTLKEALAYKDLAIDILLDSEQVAVVDAVGDALNKAKEQSND